MNKARGEVTVTLGDFSFPACATLGALARVEGRICKPLGDILVSIGEGSYSAALVVMEECCTDDEAREEISRAVVGPVELVTACMDILRAGGLVGGKGGKKQKGQG